MFPIAITVSVWLALCWPMMSGWQLGLAVVSLTLGSFATLAALNGLKLALDRVTR